MTTQNTKQSGSKKNTESNDQKLINLAIQQKYFYDNLERIYAQLDNNKMVDIDSKDYSGWIIASFYEKYSSMPNPTQLKMLKLFLNFHAKNNGSLIAVHNRVSFENNTIWLDLANKENRAVKISKSGWEVITNPSVYFRRMSHMDALPIPVEGGTLEELFGYFNIPDQQDIAILLPWILTALIPHIEKPFFWFVGPPGSGKTTIPKLIKSLVDPVAQRGGIMLTGKAMEVAQQLDHHYLPFFDNISTMSKPVSNLFCLGYSKGTASKRANYTDADDYHFDMSGSAMFTSINMPKIGKDFIERSLGINFNPISPEKRMPDERLMREFLEARPRILGALLSVLAKTLEMKPQIEIDRLYRIADFHEWGAAAAEATGIGLNNFDISLSRFYEVPVSRATNSLQFAEPLVEAIVAFMSDKPFWEGYAKDLVVLLRDFYFNENLVLKTASQLGRRLRKVIEPLSHLGIIIEISSYNTRRGTPYRIWNKNLSPEQDNTLQEDCAGVDYGKIVNEIMDDSSGFSAVSESNADKSSAFVEPKDMDDIR